MSATLSILPATSTPAERAVEAALARTDALPVPVRDLWNPATCPVALLPWLAWAFSVDEWQPDWSDSAKRAVIASAVFVHRHKGTVGSILAAIVATGLPGAVLQERWGSNLHDGSFLHDGSRTYASADHWAEYRITLLQPITLVNAQRFRALVGRIAPARCHLKALSYLESLNSYNSVIHYDGAHSHGVA